MDGHVVRAGGAEVVRADGGACWHQRSVMEGECMGCCAGEECGGGRCEMCEMIGTQRKALLSGKNGKVQGADPPSRRRL
jgi:hypothetical protein